MKENNEALILGENAKKLRVKHNFTKKKMCEIMGIGIKSLNGYCSKKIEHKCYICPCKAF